jgi:hypothetical protein
VFARARPGTITTMQMPAALRSLDDRVLGARGRRRGTVRSEAVEPTGSRDGAADRGTARDAGRAAPRRPRGDGLAAVLAVVWRVCRLVLLVLGLLLVVAIVCLVLPTNRHNGVVSTVLSWAQHVAGPLKDVFTAKDPDRARLYNYALAAVVYFVLSALVAKLPTGRRKAA